MKELWLNEVHLPYFQKYSQKYDTSSETSNVIKKYKLKWCCLFLQIFE